MYTASQDDSVKPSTSRLAVRFIIANPPRAHTDFLHPRLTSSLDIVVRSTWTSSATLKRRLTQRPYQLSRIVNEVRSTHGRLLPESRVFFRPRRVRSDRALRWDFGRFGRWGRLKPLDFAVVEVCFSCQACVRKARGWRAEIVQFADSWVESRFGFLEGPVLLCMASRAAVLETEER